MNRGKHRHFGNQPSRMTVAQKMEIANKGIAFFNQDKFEEAAKLFADAIAVMPGLTTLHYNLGTSLAKLGKFDRAILSFEKAVSVRRVIPPTQAVRLDRHDSQSVECVGKPG